MLPMLKSPRANTLLNGLEVSLHEVVMVMLVVIVVVLLVTAAVWVWK